MSDSKVPLLGRLAVHYKLITQAQLSQALADQGDHSKLGEHLVAEGHLQAKQLDRLLKIQQDMLVKHRAAKATEAASPEPEAGAASPTPARLPSPVVEKMPLPRPPRTAPLEERPSRNAPKPSNALPGSDDTFSPRALEKQAPVKERRKVQLSMVDGETDRPVATAAGEVAPVATAAGEVAPAATATQEVAPVATPTAEVATVEVGAPPRPAGCEGRKEQLHDLLRQASEARASDLHIHSGARLQFRVHGELTDQGDAVLERADCEAMLVDTLDDTQWSLLAKHGQVDFAYSLEGVGRFRCNFYRQQRGLDGTFRLITPRPPTLDDLGLPAMLGKFTGFHQGMVLLTGPAGCGKSATMAALVDMVNETREEHIITVEDPIEVVHPSKKCLVNQRQVGPHTETFARALRAALREDPDVISIGELRDLETISLALHTNSAMRTINRLIGVFPPNQQSQIRTMVSESLRAVISQRLVVRQDGKGRVPALEVMIVNHAIGNLIRENKTVQLQSILQTGASHGMCLLDDSLTKLVGNGTITKEEALRHCDDRRRFDGTQQHGAQEKWPRSIAFSRI